MSRGQKVVKRIRIPVKPFRILIALRIQKESLNQSRISDLFSIA